MGRSSHLGSQYHLAEQLPDIHGYKSIQMLNDWVVKGAEPAKFTEVTDVVLITRDNFKVELKKKGL